MAIKTQSTGKSRREQAASRRLQDKNRTVLFVAGSALILLSIIGFLMIAFPSQNVGAVRMGAPLGEFSLTDINGKTVHLSDYQGKPVLINAWATWCPPCKAEMPLLNQYYQAHAQQGFVLLAVNAGDTQAEAAAFASQKELAFPVLLDPGTRLLNQLGISSFPTSFLIGRDGKVKTIHIGMFTKENIEAEITPFLSE